MTQDRNKQPAREKRRGDRSLTYMKKRSTKRK